MKNKLLTFLTCVMIACLSAFCLTACNKGHEHSFTSYVSDNNATCTTNATATAKCDKCGEINKIEVGNSKLPHSFTNYFSDNNATYDADGTKTAKCDNCTATDTVEDVGSKIPPTDASAFLFSDGVITSLTDYGKTLTDIIIPSTYNNKPVTSIGNSAFFNCESLTSIVIPDSVTSIGDDAFWWCTSLTNIVIPNNITSIGNRVFFGCRSLTNIVIPNSVTSIGEQAFAGCHSLTSVTIGNSVTSIGEYAFLTCTSLTSIKYRGSELQWNAISKGSDWDLGTGNYTITYNYTGN